MWAQQTGDLVPLSVQELISCEKRDSACEGGLPDNAYSYIQTHGLVSEEYFPYQSSDGELVPCDVDDWVGPNVYNSYALPDVVVPTGWISGFKDIPKKREDIMREVLARHPISVAVDATKWQFYKSGIFNHLDCGASLNHAVQIVGYSMIDKFYTVRNSWGTGYGEDGYIRVVMDHDMCGIAQSASFPTVLEQRSAVAI